MAADLSLFPVLWIFDTVTKAVRETRLIHRRLNGMACGEFQSVSIDMTLRIARILRRFFIRSPCQGWEKGCIAGVSGPAVLLSRYPAWNSMASRTGSSARGADGFENYEPRVNAGRVESQRHHADLPDWMNASTTRSRRLSGIPPFFSTTSWNLRKSNLLPKASRALSRSSTILISPIL